MAAPGESHIYPLPTTQSRQTSPLTTPTAYIILGGGVAGLTTALELHSRSPTSPIILLAKHLPGDLSLSYTSPWAGANWLSVATDNGRQEAWDAVTYAKFGELADEAREAGVLRMPIRAVFDNAWEEAGVLSEGTGRVWYGGLVGGLRVVEGGELPEGARCGFECDSFVVDVTRYLPW